MFGSVVRGGERPLSQVADFSIFGETPRERQ